MKFSERIINQREYFEIEIAYNEFIRLSEVVSNNARLQILS